MRITIYFFAIALVFLVLLTHRFAKPRLFYETATESERQAPTAAKAPSIKPMVRAPVSSAFWEGIKTNGMVFTSQLIEGPNAHLKLRKHVQLRAILKSPVRDSEECQQVAQLIQKYGFDIDLIPMAYSYAWQRKDFARRFPDESDAKSGPNPERLFRIGMADTDFLQYLERNYGRTSQDFIQELQGITPSRDFGAIDTRLVDGEPLYE